MSYLKRISVLGFIVFCLFGCGQNQSNNSSNGGTGDRADAASYKALVGPKWCLAPTGAGDSAFVLSWNFRDDGNAYLTKTKVDNRQVLFNQKKKWNLRSRTLRILEENSGVEIVKKEISFALDLATGVQAMTWAEPSQPADCAGNSPCSSTSIQAMTLTECE